MVMNGNAMNPSVEILVLIHNSKKWIHRCLASLMETEYDNFHITVLDNNSDDIDPMYLKKFFPKIEIIHFDKNIGWCAANNYGIINSRSDYIYLSNSDVYFFDKQWLQILIDESIKNNCTISGPIQYQYDNTSCLNEWSKYILKNGNRDVHYMWSSLISINQKEYDYQDAENRNLKVYFIQGAAMLIKRELFNQIGIFDSLYFIYYDELDFCRRNKRIGNSNILITKSKVMHYGGGDTDSNRINYLFQRNKYLFIISDYKLTLFMKMEIIKKWIKKDYSLFKENRSLIRYYKMLIDILLNLLKCLKKRRREKKMEKYIIEEKVKKCINKVLSDEEQIKNLNCSLKNDWALDSLEMMELIIYIEEEFDFVLPNRITLSDLDNPEYLVNVLLEMEL